MPDLNIQVDYIHFMIRPHQNIRYHQWEDF
jgi:hypothetical protein